MSVTLIYYYINYMSIWDCRAQRVNTVLCDFTAEQCCHLVIPLDQFFLTFYHWQLPLWLRKISGHPSLKCIYYFLITLIKLTSYRKPSSYQSPPFISETSIVSEVFPITPKSPLYIRGPYIWIPPFRQSTPSYQSTPLWVSNWVSCSQNPRGTQMAH